MDSVVIIHHSRLDMAVNVCKYYTRHSDSLIDWCLTPTLAVFQLYRGV